ncbi:MAG: polyribonucleotide nucleotidyltransferase [Solirubrobacterales bacterium]
MSRFDERRVAVQVGSNEISFTTGKLAKQAGGAVVVQTGDTMVLVTATAGGDRGMDFLPLTVDVEERMYAKGKIPGSFFKREGRSGEKATLVARMIDRPLRPLFPDGWTRDTQIVAMPLSVDEINPYDILAMNGASAALMLSDIPFVTPVGAVRVGLIDGEFVVNPDEDSLLQEGESTLDLVVAGTEEAILMVEAGADEVTEEQVLEAFEVAHAEIKKLCKAQHDLREQKGKEKVDFSPPAVEEGLFDQIAGKFTDQMTAAVTIPEKLERYAKIDEVKGEIKEAFAPADDADDDVAEKRTKDVSSSAGKLEKEITRKLIAVDKKRPDGRAKDEIRPIECEAGVIPRTHGSGLFTRGETQIMSLASLGTTREEMRLDTLGLETSKRYFHHYNFPPFSVGEAGFMRGPKRRDIGHGALAERALVPVIPSTEDFPYTIRVVSETLESNGSSSMGSVCGSTMSLMDAGVPIKKPVSGIAMGLIKEGDDYIVLSDIAGVEDHLGDMDFKVAGTPDGITALQMDIKITGVTIEILRDALAQAKDGRAFIMGKMFEAIDRPREEMSEFAPRISTIKIDTDKIGVVIGKGGETIRALCEEFESEINVEDDGTIQVYSTSGALGERLIDRIRSMTKEVEIGDEFTGTVVKTTTFGAFVELTKGTDGLLHISNVKPGERVETVEDVLERGEQIEVKVVEVDADRGRIGLRLADDPAIQGKSNEELVGIGAGGGGGGGGDRGDRGGRGGDRGDRGGRGGDRGGRNGGGRGGERRPRERSRD